MSYFEELQRGKIHGFPEKEKKKNFINKKSAKKIAEDLLRKENGSDAATDAWFDERRKEMTGKCLISGCKTEKDNDAMFRASVAHLFPKRKNMFPSIALHPENFLELCFYAPSHHTLFDTLMLTFADIKEKYPTAWKEILRKATILYPLMTAEEQGRVPDFLLNEIKNNLH